MKRFAAMSLLMAIAIISSSFKNKKPTPSSISKTLAFPVGGKSYVGSFWGDVRDGGKRKHRGIDIFARKGTPVVALTDGFIVSKGNTPRGGKTLWLQSVTHPWTVYYAHLDQQKVKRGQYVKKGQIIGTVGNTGNARYTPSHLHFGIYTFLGAVNPLPYVKNAPKLVLKPVAKQQSKTVKNASSKSTKSTVARKV